MWCMSVVVFTQLLYKYSLVFILSYVDFARYAAIVKNLRGVIVADLNEDGVEDSIR